MRRIITDICTRMEKFVVPKNDYSLCREDGMPGAVDKMWEVWCHEWARLCYEIIIRRALRRRTFRLRQ